MKPLDIKSSVLFWQQDGFSVKQEVTDWAGAFLVAVLIYFIILPLVLGTSAPAVVVSSCSEKGYLNTGDIIVNQGISIDGVNAPEVTVDSLLYVTPIFENGKAAKLNFSGQIVNRTDQADIVTYVSNPLGAQIIHRVFAKVNYHGQTFLITQGDANPYPDQLWLKEDKGGWCWDQNSGYCISTLVSQQNLLGKKVGPTIPLAGHVKLFLCDIIPFCEGHANLGTGYEYILSC